MVVGVNVESSRLMEPEDITNVYNINGNAEMSFDQSLPKWTLRSLAKIFPWGQRSVFNELKYFSIDFFILLFKVLLDRVTFYRLLLSIFLVVTFLKKQFHPYLRPFF